MKPQPTKTAHLLFGDLVERLYAAYGNRRAHGILCFLLKAQLVAFHGEQRLQLCRVK